MCITLHDRWKWNGSPFAKILPLSNVRAVWKTLSFLFSITIATLRKKWLKNILAKRNNRSFGRGFQSNQLTQKSLNHWEYVLYSVVKMPNNWLHLSLWSMWTRSIFFYVPHIARAKHRAPSTEHQHQNNTWKQKWKIYQMKMCLAISDCVAHKHIELFKGENENIFLQRYHVKRIVFHVELNTFWYIRYFKIQYGFHNNSTDNVSLYQKWWGFFRRIFFCSEGYFAVLKSSIRYI